MKKVIKKIATIIIINSLFFGFINAQPINKGAEIPGLEKKKIVSFQAGEVMLYGENCLDLSKSVANVRFTTSTSGSNNEQFFIYENGTRKGPFANISEVEKPCNIEQYCQEYVSNDDIDLTSQYISMNEMGQQIIKFNGKEYGPYIMVTEFKLNQNKNIFYAIVTDASMKIQFINSEGKALDIKGMPSKVFISADGKKGYVKVDGTQSFSDLMSGNINMADANKSFLFSIDGAQIGPFNKDDLWDGAIWFDKFSSNLYYKSQGFIYKNGVKLNGNFENVNKCYLWFGLNNDNYAYNDYEKITFSDKSIYPYPLAVNTIIENGKVYLVWITLENGTDVYYCKKAL